MIIGGVFEAIGLYVMHFNYYMGFFFISAGVFLVFSGFTGFWLGSIPSDPMITKLGLGFDPQKASLAQKISKNK